MENTEAGRIPDALLVERACSGKKEAFDELIGRYARKAVSVAFAVLGDWEAAKDASQNAFVKAYFGLSGFKKQAAFSTWLIRIVINEAKNAARKERVKRLFVFGTRRGRGDGEDLDLLEAIPSGEKLQIETLADKETKEQLERAMAGLPEKEKAVFVLRYVHEMPLEEIAGSLGVALGTVKAHLSHATEKVKRQMKSERIGHVSPPVNRLQNKNEQKGGEGCEYQ